MRAGRDPHSSAPNRHPHPDSAPVPGVCGTLEPRRAGTQRDRSIWRRIAWGRVERSSERFRQSHGMIQRKPSLRRRERAGDGGIARAVPRREVPRFPLAAEGTDVLPALSTQVRFPSRWREPGGPFPDSFPGGGNGFEVTPCRTAVRRATERRAGPPRHPVDRGPPPPIQRGDIVRGRRSRNPNGGFERTPEGVGCRPRMPAELPRGRDTSPRPGALLLFPEYRGPLPDAQDGAAPAAVSCAQPREHPHPLVEHILLRVERVTARRADRTRGRVRGHGRSMPPGGHLSFENRGACRTKFRGPGVGNPQTEVGPKRERRRPGDATRDRPLRSDVAPWASLRIGRPSRRGPPSVRSALGAAVVDIARYIVADVVAQFLPPYCNRIGPAESDLGAGRTVG